MLTKLNMMGINDYSVRVDLKILWNYVYNDAEYFSDEERSYDSTSYVYALVKDI